MGQGLSPLQHRILKALEGFPTFEASVESDTVHLKGWAEPKHLFAAVDIIPTPTNRAVLSKALDRLHQRGFVAKFHGEVAIQGKAARYALITDARNAGARSSGPLLVMSRPARRRITVSG